MNTWLVSKRDNLGPDFGATYWRIITPTGVVFECQEVGSHTELLAEQMVKAINEIA